MKRVPGPTMQISFWSLTSLNAAPGGADGDHRLHLKPIAVYGGNRTRPL